MASESKPAPWVPSSATHALSYAHTCTRAPPRSRSARAQLQARTQASCMCATPCLRVWRVRCASPASVDGSRTLSRVRERRLGTQVRTQLQRDARSCASMRVCASVRSWNLTVPSMPPLESTLAVTLWRRVKTLSASHGFASVKASQGSASGCNERTEATKARRSTALKRSVRQIPHISLCHQSNGANRS